MDPDACLFTPTAGAAAEPVMARATLLGGRAALIASRYGGATSSTLCKLGVCPWPCLEPVLLMLPV